MGFTFLGENCGYSFLEKLSLAEKAFLFMQQLEKFPVWLQFVAKKRKKSCQMVIFTIVSLCDERKRGHVFIFQKHLLFFFACMIQLSKSDKEHCHIILFKYP